MGHVVGLHAEADDLRGADAQPVHVAFDGGNGQPYAACKDVDLAQLFRGVLPAAEGGGVYGKLVGGSEAAVGGEYGDAVRSEEHTSELQSLMRISYAVFCLKKKTLYCILYPFSLTIL